MTTTRVRRGKGERGLALVAVLLVLVLLMGIAGAFHGGVLSETTLRGSHARATAGFYAAEAGINRGIGDYRTIFNNYNVPTGSDFDPHSLTLGPRTVTYQLSDAGNNPRTVTVPIGRPFALLNAIEYRYTANASSSSHTGDTEASLGTEFDVDYVPLFQFLAFYQGDLEINPGPTMNLYGPIHTNGDLYFNSNTTCSGTPCVGGLSITENLPTIPTVHITTAGQVNRNRKDVLATCGGTVQIAMLQDANNDGALDLRTMPCSGTQSSAALVQWLGSIKSRQPRVSVPPVSVLSRQGGPNATFWNNAQLRIVLDLFDADTTGRVPIVAVNADGTTNATQNNLLQVFMAAKPGRIFYNDMPNVGSRTVPTSGSCGAGSYCDQASYTPNFLSDAAVYACAGSDLGLFTGCSASIGPEPALISGPFAGQFTYRRGGFYNQREGQWVTMLSVNVRDLLVWNAAQISANQLFPPNDMTNGGPVIFLSVAGPNSTTAPASMTRRYGVRVFGTQNFGRGIRTFPAQTTPPGVTMASDQGFYVEGDYNVADAANSQLPAAILADTINVLSNHWSMKTWASPGAGCLPSCWNDCQSIQALGGSGCRPASNTTINAAFLGGVDTTPLNGGSAAYNGGLENYPRFLESWTGRTLFYRGSFVSLGNPIHNNGAWCGTGTGCGLSGIYDPPVRNWGYDTTFQNVAWLPPLTPRVVSVQQIVFTENFR